MAGLEVTTEAVRINILISISASWFLVAVHLKK